MVLATPGGQSTHWILYCVHAGPERETASGPPSDPHTWSPWREEGEEVTPPPPNSAVIKYVHVDGAHPVFPA